MKDKILAHNDFLKRDILWAVGIKVLVILFLVGGLKIFKEIYPQQKESPVFRQIKKG